MRLGFTAYLLLFGCVFQADLLRADETSLPRQPLQPQPATMYALTGATVWVTAEKSVENAVVLIADGKIVGVGAGLSIPPQAQQIALPGRTIYPGFIDAYHEQSISSDRLTGTARYWNGQVTPQLSVADQPAVPEDTAALRKQGFVARLIAPDAGVVRGRSAVLSTAGGDPARTLLSRDAAQHLLLTLSRRSRGSGYPGSPMGAVALARQAILDAQWYRDAHAAVAADPALPLPEQNDALAALQPVLNGSMPIMVTASNEQFVQRADQFAAEFGLTLVIVGSGREYRRLSEIAQLRRPMILPLAFPRPPAVSTPEAAENVTLEDLLHWDIAPENPARVDAAGIRFAFTTSRLSSSSDFLKSLRKAVSRGLSRTSALRALTSGAAEILGISSQLGTLEPGRLASLVITDGDLFGDQTKVIETWVSGQRFQHEASPARQSAGSYELALSQSGTFPQKLYLEITDTAGRLKGRISRNPLPAAEARKGRRYDDKPADADKPAAAAAPAAPAASDAPDAGAASAAAAATAAAAAAPAAAAVAAQPQADPQPAKTKEVVELKSVRLENTRLSANFTGTDWGIEGSIRFSLAMTEPDPALRDRPAAIGTLIWPDGTTSVTTASRIDAAAPAAVPAGTAEAAPAAAGTAAADKPSVQPAAAAPVKVTASFEVNYPLGSFGRTSLPAVTGPVAFVHATIWTCGPAGILEDATLLIDGGRIVSVGRDIPIPANAQVVDVRGMHLTPGIIDCHSHFATDGGVNEGTQAVTSEVRVGDFVDANDITIYRQLAGGVTAANILHGSANPIGGQNQVVKLRWGMTGDGLKFTEAPAGIKFALGENVKQSNRTEGGGRYPATRMGVEQVFRDAFEAARDYQQRHDSWQKSRRGLPPRRDLELEAISEVVLGRRWIHCHSYRQDEILALLEILEEYNIRIGTLQHILEGYKVADELAKHGAMASAFSDWWAYKFEVYDAIPYAGALMHQQGVVVSFNSDDGELARHLNQEAAKAVKYGGIPREEALKFVTLNPAKQLR
ncbi:MAG: amidohydrolase family protein, partial [Planctomyces sp.]